MYCNQHEDALARPLIYDRSEASNILRRRASWATRLTPLFFSSISLLLSILVCVAERRQWYISANNKLLYSFIINDRSGVQTIITIIVSLLAFLWTFSICSTFNLTIRELLHRRPRTINRLRFLIAVSRRSIDVNLPTHLLALSAIVLAIGLLPAFLWTGALTPTETRTTTNYNVTMPEPANGTYVQPVRNEPCTISVQSNGTFTNCPGIDLLASLVQIMGTAAKDQVQNHSKLDNTPYVYRGRSYGAAASVGLFEESFTSDMQQYSFQQTSFLSKASCIYNTSSLWVIDPEPMPLNDTGLSAFWVHGTRPNQQDEFHFWYLAGGSSSDKIVAFTADGVWEMHNGLQGRPPYMLAIAAGKNYSTLNQVQCVLEITPTLFNVAVDIGARSIGVTPTNLTPQEIDPVYRQRAMAVTNLELMTADVAFYLNSPVGEALTKIADTNDVLSSTERGLEAVLDAIFASYSGYALSQGMVSQYSTKIYSKAFQLGTSRDHALLLVLNILGFLLVLSGIVYSRLYTRTPAFDFADGCSVMIAAHNGNKTDRSLSWCGKASDTDSLWFVDSGIDSFGPSRIIPHNRVSFDVELRHRAEDVQCSVGSAQSKQSNLSLLSDRSRSSQR